MSKKMKSGKNNLSFGFGLVILMLVVVGVVGFLAVNIILKATTHIIESDARLLEHSGRLRSNVLGMRRYEKDSFINIANAAKVEEYFKKWEDQYKRSEERIADLEKAADKKDLEMLKGMKSDLAVYGSGFNKVLGLIRNDKIKTTADANTAIVEVKDETHRIEKQAIEYAQRSSENMNKQATVIKGIARQALILFIALVVFAIGVSIVLARFIKRSITTPLQRGVRLAEAIAGGDLSQRIDEREIKGEVGPLLAAMESMTEKLKGIMAEISSAGDSMASASQQLSSSSEQLSGGTRTQAEKTAQIATASTEMSQTIGDIANNTTSIAASAAQTVMIAGEGGKIVERSVKEVRAIAETVSESAMLMSSLGDRSRQIGEIIGVIKDIADQTNLLALNAAIEAARAGEQGRGFAVVADEVRKLAERTTKATAEISGMITAIQEEVQKAVHSMDEGTKRVNVGVEYSTKTGDALRGIVNSVNELQSMVQQIATATDEMSSVSDQINGDIEGVAAVANETSLSSHQIAQSANDLAKLSLNLTAIVGKFRV